jgi:hypothetical protein
MSKLEIKQEIAIVKQKLLNSDIGQIERTDLMVCLLALYESAMKDEE